MRGRDRRRRCRRASLPWRRARAPERRLRDRGRRRRRPCARARAPHRSRDRRFRLGLAGGLAAAEAAGAVVERHPAAKDATDLELALDAAIALEPARILVVGSAGGRLDHLLGSILLLGRRPLCGGDGRCVSGRQPDLGDPRLADADRHARRPRHAAARARPGRRRLDERARVSLHDETLRPGTTRGVSNVFAAAEAQITVVDGCLVAVQPGPEREESL